MLRTRAGALVAALLTLIVTAPASRASGPREELLQALTVLLQQPGESGLERVRALFEVSGPATEADLKGLRTGRAFSPSAPDTATAALLVGEVLGGQGAPARLVSMVDRKTEVPPDHFDHLGLLERRAVKRELRRWAPRIAPLEVRDGSLYTQVDDPSRLGAPDLEIWFRKSDELQVVRLLVAESFELYAFFFADARVGLGSK